MTMDPVQAQRLLQEAASHLSRGDAAAARQAIAPLFEPGTPVPPPLFLLAQACRLEGDAAAEEAALDRLLAVQPGHVGGLIMKGDRRAAAGDQHEAERVYRRALAGASAAQQALPPSLETELRRIAGWIGDLSRERLAKVDSLLTSGGFPAGRRSDLIEETLAILRGEADIQLQQPTSFYVPGLPQRAFYERDEFAWAAEVEAQTDAIRDELNALLGAENDGFVPYLPADARASSGAPNAHLVGDSAWSAFHLYRAGQPEGDRKQRCPVTFDAMARAPQPVIPGKSPFAIFSMLKPGAHIRPHHGLYNHRLICHLPLVVPDGCMLRVGNHQRPWKVGELLMFDDSVEHEAWNRSDRQRVILLFEIWKPELGEADRAAISLILEATPTHAED